MKPFVMEIVYLTLALFNYYNLNLSFFFYKLIYSDFNSYLKN